MLKPSQAIDLQFGRQSRCSRNTFIFYVKVPGAGIVKLDLLLACNNTFTDRFEKYIYSSPWWITLGVVATAIAVGLAASYIAYQYLYAPEEKT